jgi:hypothetical protein
MNNVSRFIAQILVFTGSLLRLVWRLALGLMGLGMVLGLVMLGVLVWLLARLLGKKPQPVNVRWQHAGRNFGFGQAQRPAEAGDVVDVQARELKPEAAATHTLPNPHKP